MILQIDSAGIQQAVQQAADIGTSFLPGDWQILAPAISSVLTLITAAIIRAWEKAQIRKEQRQERRAIIQAYLEKDSAALAAKVSELQNKVR